MPSRKHLAERKTSVDLPIYIYEMAEKHGISLKTAMIYGVRNLTGQGTIDKKIKAQEEQLQLLKRLVHDLRQCHIKDHHIEGDKTGE